MARRKKELILSPSEHQIMLDYLSVIDIKGKPARFIIECVSYGIMDRSFVDEIKAGGVLSQETSDKIFFLSDFYQKLTPHMARILLGKFKSKQRKSICNTAGMGKAETYVYNLLKNARKEGRKLRTDYILSVLSSNLGADIKDSKSVAYYKNLITRVRRRLTNESYQKNRH